LFIYFLIFSRQVIIIQNAKKEAIGAAKPKASFHTRVFPKGRGSTQE